MANSSESTFLFHHCLYYALSEIIYRVNANIQVNGKGGGTVEFILPTSDTFPEEITPNFYSSIVIMIYYEKNTCNSFYDFCCM